MEKKFDQKPNAKPIGDRVETRPRVSVGVLPQGVSVGEILVYYGPYTEAMT